MAWHGNNILNQLIRKEPWINEKSSANQKEPQITKKKILHQARNEERNLGNKDLKNIEQPIN